MFYRLKIINPNTNKIWLESNGRPFRSISEVQEIIQLWRDFYDIEGFKFEIRHRMNYGDITDNLTKTGIIGGARAAKRNGIGSGKNYRGQLPYEFEMEDRKEYY